MADISTTTPGAEYTFGAQVKLRATIRDDTGALVDPTEVTLIVEEPDGTETIHRYTAAPSDITRASVGVFYFDHTTVQVGTHEYRWKTESPIGAKESWFVVPASRVANP
jgi:hypothetical protein